MNKLITSILVCCFAFNLYAEQLPAKQFSHPERIRYDQHCFTIEGRDIFILSAAFHYFRVPQELWRDRFRKIKEAGFNTVETYVPWNWHERTMPRNVKDYSQCDFDDLKAWLKMAHEEFGLYTIVRPGPFICAEWAGGGYPRWIAKFCPAKYDTSFWLRSNHPEHMKWTKHWYDAVCPVFAEEQLTRKKSGEKGIIMVQLENEYIYFGMESEKKEEVLRDMAAYCTNNGIEVPLFTCVTPEVRGSKDAVISQLFDMDNQYVWWNIQEAKSRIEDLKRQQPNAPAFVCELQGGWFSTVGGGLSEDSYLMNYYLFFDSDAVKRTIWLLRGKDPVTSHSNTIMDYTFYWFLSVYDYYMYSGDRHFVNQLYPRMQTMMDYVLGRTNKNGMVEGMTGDWVFVDWADGYLDKKGELSFEQILFCRSLETMALCAELVGDANGKQKYEKLAATLKAKLEPAFWNNQKQAFVHNCVNGQQSDAVTRYANMFSVFFQYLNEDKQQAIKQSVLLNDSILKITTPYMRFYELEALCALGEQDAVMKEMKAYWGGMLKEGATSFWEKYNPEEIGTQHLAMYGRPYGKSLCHAWGASPIYLLGKYYLGVKPVKEGYKEFAIAPVLGGLKWMEGTVPTPNGNIHVYMNSKTMAGSQSRTER